MDWSEADIGVLIHYDPNQLFVYETRHADDVAIIIGKDYVLELLTVQWLKTGEQFLIGIDALEPFTVSGKDDTGLLWLR